MSHSSAVINAGFYTLQSSEGSNTKHTVISQYCLDEKDIFQRMLPIIPKVTKLTYLYQLINIFFYRIALLKLMILLSQV